MSMPVTLIHLFDMVSIERKAYKRTAFQRKKMRERHNGETIFTLTLTFRPYPHQGKFFR
jgi:hypothetical protein